MQHGKKTINEGGWSLIEMVAVILVAAIILPALIIPFVEGTRGLDIPVIRGNLAFLAQEAMEKKVVCFSSQSVSWDNFTFPASFADYTSSFTTSTASFTPLVGNPVEGDVIEITIYHEGQSLSLTTVKTEWE